MLRPYTPGPTDPVKGLRGTVGRKPNTDAAGRTPAGSPRMPLPSARSGGRWYQPAALMASSTFAGCSAALATFLQCRFTLPSGPTQTVDRITPMVFLPYIIFSP